MVLSAPQPVPLIAVRMLRRLKHFDLRPFGIQVSPESKAIPKNLIVAPIWMGFRDPYSSRFGSSTCLLIENVKVSTLLLHSSNLRMVSWTSKVRQLCLRNVVVSVYSLWCRPLVININHGSHK